jgi:hypothetical protein
LLTLGFSTDQDGVLIKDRYPGRFDDLVQGEAVRLGEQFQVAGKWCSFVAVASNDAEIATPNQRERDLPNEYSNLDFSGKYICSLATLRQFPFDGCIPITQLD